MTARCQALAKGGLLVVAASLLPLVAVTPSHGKVQRQPEDLDAVREVVARHVIGAFEPPCVNYWDHSTYCLEFEGGEQPTPEFLKRLHDVAPGIQSLAYCRETLGMRGDAIDPEIRIRSVTWCSKDEAFVDVVAFCGHGTATVRRVAGVWKYAGSEGGWVGSCLEPTDCVRGSVRNKKKAP